jgi:tellurite resistance protein TehA-like permease
VNHRLNAAVRELPPGAFAFVMATGIVSSAFLLVGWTVLSVVLAVFAVVGLVLLTGAMLWRIARFPDAVLADAADPGHAFGFFTIVAAFNVVAVRLYTPDAPAVSIVLAVISVPVWVLLSYGIPGMMMLRPHPSPVSSEINGSWFLWVVGTQSLAVIAAILARSDGFELVAEAAVALWGVGVLLYLMLTTLVTLRLLTTRNDAHSLGPSYWIYMGATAITVLAGSTILTLPGDLAILRTTATVISGLTYILWAFGVWWIPLLIVFGVWRHLVHHEPQRYESRLWSIVFPLGMYAAASIQFGMAADLQHLVIIGRVGVWFAGFAWLAVLVAMLLPKRGIPIR